MIGFLRGKVFSTGTHSLLLDVNGVGYEVFMTVPALMSLRAGEETFVYTHYHQKEDLVAIFGFLNMKTKEIFELLTGVSGLGPKTTLGVLSNIGEEDLISAIREGDVSSLVRVPGIGNKTAARIILELQDKVLNLYGSVPARDGEAGIDSSGGLLNDAESALMFLGYNKKEIGDVLKKLIKGKKQPDLDALIRDALKELGR